MGIANLLVLLLPKHGNPSIMGILLLVCSKRERKRESKPILFHSKTHFLITSIILTLGLLIPGDILHFSRKEYFYVWWRGD
jgi:hypothetical protein